MSTVLRRCLLVRNRSLRWQSSEPKNQAAESANDTSPGKGLNLGKQVLEKNVKFQELKKNVLSLTRNIFSHVDQSIDLLILKEKLLQSKAVTK